MSNRDFVSISGITNHSELMAIAEIDREGDLEFPIVIGYQISNKSINEGTRNARQPEILELGDLSRATYDQGFVPAFHYYTKDPSTTIGDLEKVAIAIGRAFPSPLVQFNTLPPSVETLKAVKEMGFRTIFKVAVANKQNAEGGFAVWKGEGVQDAKLGDYRALMPPIRERKDWIDYAMFDPSHGTNLGLDLSEDGLAIKFGRELQKIDTNHIGLIYAGGINPQNVRTLTATLSTHFPKGFSIDVESGVRTIRKEGERILEDKLDIKLVRDYLHNSKLN